MTYHTPLSADDLERAELLFTQVIVPVMAAEHQAENNPRDGAVLIIRDTEDKEMLRVASGQASEEDFAGYDHNADLKNDALANHPNIRSSWEVRQGDLSEQPYPGSIRTTYDDRFAISGFNWQRDMVGCLWLGWYLRRITMDEVRAIARKSLDWKVHEPLFNKLNTGAIEIA